MRRAWLCCAHSHRTGAAHRRAGRRSAGTGGRLRAYRGQGGFLLQQGFTLVWVGWEFDVPPSTKYLRLQAPVATDHGKPIFGLVRSEWIGDKRVTRISLGDRFLQAYPMADPNAPGTQLSVR